MNNLRVTSTAYPDGRHTTYTDGMNTPSVLDFSKVMKTASMEEASKSWAKNKPRKGKVSHEALSLVEQAQELANQATKKLRKIYKA